VIHALVGSKICARWVTCVLSLPTTHWNMRLGNAAIAVIFPFAGFWSKDEIQRGPSSLVPQFLWWLVGLLTAFLPPLYVSPSSISPSWAPSRVIRTWRNTCTKRPPQCACLLILLAILSLLGRFFARFHRSMEACTGSRTSFCPAVGIVRGGHSLRFADVVLMLISLTVALQAGAGASGPYVREPSA